MMISWLLLLHGVDANATKITFNHSSGPHSFKSSHPGCGELIRALGVLDALVKQLAAQSDRLSPLGGRESSGPTTPQRRGLPSPAKTSARQTA
jgi:hypothetical protein